MPVSLPPYPPLKMDSHLENILSSADRAIGRLDGIGRMLPNPDLFISMYVKKEAVLSSRIEGIQTTFPDLLESEGGKPLNELPEDIGEVVNYISALKLGLRMIKEESISISLIKAIHAVLLLDIRGSDRDPGQFRDRPVGIGPPGCDLHSATFIPPPPSEIIRLMEELSAFIESQEKMPPLILCGLVHSQFETIHPFRDGNGRLGRLLITLLLCRNGVLSHPLLYLSHYFLRNRGEYYNSLMSVRDAGDWEGWLRFFLKGIYTVSNEAVEKTGKILELRKKDSSLIRERIKRGKSFELLELLLLQPVISIKTIGENLGVAFATAGSLAEDFVKAGILEITSDRRRNRLFTYNSYIKLLIA